MRVTRTGAAALCRLAMLCGLALGSSACATVVSGTSQTLAVDSEPKGAACTIDQKGALIGVIDATPGTAKVPRSIHDIVVSCTLSGYEKSDNVLAARSNWVGLGNAPFGVIGLAGILIDHSSGASSRYPEHLTVIMNPTQFPDDAARDAYYAGLRSRLDDAANAAIKRITETCSTNSPDLCRAEAKKISDVRDKAVTDLEQQRLAAKVAPAS